MSAHENYVLGSGKLYVALSSSIVDPENLTATEEGSLVEIGDIDSDASITINTTSAEVNPANRKHFIKKIPISKNVRFSTGVLTWNLKNVNDFLLGATYTEDGTTGEKKTVVNLKDKLPEVYLRFVHTKEDGGELICNIYHAEFDGELNLSFAAENATTSNYEFVGLGTDNLNYVEFIETV
jgi:hypothetical protein